MPEGFKAGSASVDITPRRWVPGIYMAGFDPGRRATGLLDTLEAGALYLADGRSEMLLVTVDAIGLMKPVVDQIRDEIQDALGRKLPILVSSTHTHAGPDTLGLWGWAPVGHVPLRSGMDQDYMAFLVHTVARAGLNAVAMAVPAGLKMASLDVPADWVRNDRKGGIVDRAAVAVAVLDETARYKALLVNFSAHPETLWEHNTLISADYPAAFRRRVRDRKKGVPLFFSGDLGGMLTPNCPEDADLEQRRAFVQKFGRSIADLAMRTLVRAETITEPPPLRVIGAPMVVPVENTRFKLARHMGILERDFPLGGVSTEAWVAGIEGLFTMVSCPGELVPELGVQVRKWAGPGPVLLMGLCCDELGYILDEHQFRSQEYAYEQSMSCGPDLTRRYMDKVQWLIDLYKKDTG